MNRFAIRFSRCEFFWLELKERPGDERQRDRETGRREIGIVTTVVRGQGNSQSMNTHRMSYQILTSVPSGSIRKNVRSACLSHERRRGGTNAKLGTHQTRQFAILRTRRTSVTQVAASKGFGYGSGTQKVQSIPKDYVKVGDLASLEGRQSKVVVFGELKFILFNVGGQVFCTEANSTAYKYPLIDAQLTKGKDLSLHLRSCKRACVCVCVCV